jgi:hypothetical protein
MTSLRFDIGMTQARIGGLVLAVPSRSGLAL